MQHSTLTSLVIAVAATFGCAYPKFEKTVSQESGGAAGNESGTATAGAEQGGAAGKGGTDSNGGGSSARGGSVGSQGGSANGGNTNGGNASSQGGGSVSQGGGSSLGGTGSGAGSSTIGQLSCQTLVAKCQSESCCTAIQLSSGSFPMGRSTVNSGTDNFASGASAELPEHTTTLSLFAMDKYEVTVGRFRAFVDAYDNWHGVGANPQVGDGANSKTANSGWGQSWTTSPTDLPADSNALKTAIQCDASSTWNATPSTSDSYPINCISWFVAFAFCVWDGGRLPTEAEWEFVAAGATQNRLYPWGSGAPDATRANFLSSAASSKIAVGSTIANGAGFFGHADLAGSVSEWVLDWYAPDYYGPTAAPVPCGDCANTTTASDRVFRGGEFSSNGYTLRVAYRGFRPPSPGTKGSGIRCARNP